MSQFAFAEDILVAINRIRGKLFSRAFLLKRQGCYFERLHLYSVGLRKKMVHDNLTASLTVAYW